MSKNLFNTIQLTKPKKNVFDLTHDVKTTMQFGELVPVMALETVPGDKFNLGAETLVRFAPLVAPVMHRFDVSIHYFFVPNRILWDGWEEFITGSKLTNQGYVERVLPYINVNQSRTNPGGQGFKCLNHFGIPRITGANTHKVNALPFAAYQRVWFDYYRDQNMQPGDWTPMVDGDNEANYWWITALQNRAWEHDYFTSCLPWAQKGPDVTVPGAVFKDVPVYVNSAGNTTYTLSATPSAPAGPNVATQTTGDGNNIMGDGLYADTSMLQAGATKINDLRRAFRLQEWLEKNARAGTRYVESILAHFGVKSSDARLQRPEYITGVKTPVQISEVLNTTGQVGGVVQGNMAGHGIAAASGHNGSYFCEEHGWIIGVVSVIPKTSYYQGIARKFLKNDRLDYFWPEFANIGEQPVENAEVYADHTNPTGTFGYIPRYAEYKFENNQIHGEFQDTLDHWHAGRKFANDPSLSADFVYCLNDNNIFAVTDPDTENLYVDVLHKVTAVRPMPKYGTPHF